MTANPTTRRIANQSQAETPAEHAERKLGELDREFCHVLYAHAGYSTARPVDLASVYGDMVPAWVRQAVARCMRDGMLTADGDGRVTLTPTGVEAARAAQREAAAWYQREMARLRAEAEERRRPRGE